MQNWTQKQNLIWDVNGLQFQTFLSCYLKDDILRLRPKIIFTNLILPGCQMSQVRQQALVGA